MLGPQPEADVADWPVTYDELEPYYAEVETAVGVAGTDGANPFAGPRSGPFPMQSGAAMYGATLSTAAAERLGDRLADALEIPAERRATRPSRRELARRRTTRHRDQAKRSARRWTYDEDG